jgi:LysM repeat protein
MGNQTLPGKIIKEELMELQKPIWKSSVSVVLLFAVFSLFLGCSQKDYSHDIKLLQDKIEQLERKLTEYEQRKEVKELKAKAEEGKAALEEQLKIIEEKYDKKSDKIEAAAAAPQVKPAVQKKPNAVNKKVYHTVTRGDTLYSISRKYKVSVAELCRLNNLKTTQHVQTGQKLLIANGSKR